MANMNNYLIELQIGKDPEIEKVFNLALKQVFSSEYLTKVEEAINKRIKIKEKTGKPGVVAWVVGTTIYINKQEFYARNIKQQIKYLLHEFLHVLHNSKSFVFFKKFKEVDILSKRLWFIIKKYTTEPGDFLNKKGGVPRHLLNKQESLSYLMNDSMDWKQMKPGGKAMFIKALDDSKVFNLKHQFWKTRLS